LFTGVRERESKLHLLIHLLRTEGGGEPDGGSEAARGELEPPGS
jgi:hypothetical protein